MALGALDRTIIGSLAAQLAMGETTATGVVDGGAREDLENMLLVGG